MKFLFDLLPVILFFVTLKVSEKTANAGAFLSSVLNGVGISANVKPDLVPIMLATIVVIIASMVQIGWVKFKHGKVDKALWISALLVVVLGCLTLYLQNDAFIKWKPTLLYWVFALVLFFSNLVWHKNIVKSMMGSNLELPDIIWQKLNFVWIGFCVALGFLNLFVAYNYSTSTWASFKLFGITGITLAFAVLQALIISKYLPKEVAKSNDTPNIPGGQ